MKTVSACSGNSPS